MDGAGRAGRTRTHPRGQGPHGPVRLVPPLPPHRRPREKSDSLSQGVLEGNWSWSRLQSSRGRSQGTEGGGWVAGHGLGCWALSQAHSLWGSNRSVLYGLQLQLEPEGAQEGAWTVKARTWEQDGALP